MRMDGSKDCTSTKKMQVLYNTTVLDFTVDYSPLSKTLKQLYLFNNI